MSLEPAPGGCTKHEVLSPPRDGGEADAACKTFNLCDDRLGADGMGLDDEACRQEGREDADLSHLSAEATLPLLDSTRTLLHESQHSPCLGMFVYLCIYVYTSI